MDSFWVLNRFAYQTREAINAVLDSQSDKERLALFDRVAALASEARIALLRETEEQEKPRDVLPAVEVGAWGRG